MSINLTRPTPVVPVVPAPTADPRDALMRALAVAETVVAQLADRPSSVGVSYDYSGAYGVEVYFHREPEQVARFAARYGVEVVEDAEYNGGSSTYTSADVLVDGVKVRGWSLMRHEAVAA
ncbi:hypothetical protein [Streptomyces sp. NPDC059071]|uniref:hypothetical protein n=1 Tax=unclassified Streptomyces TaxID=2593676 RepID=UPI0036537D26